MQCLISISPDGPVISKSIPLWSNKFIIHTQIYITQTWQKHIKLKLAFNPFFSLAWVRNLFLLLTAKNEKLLGVLDCFNIGHNIIKKWSNWDYHAIAHLSTSQCYCRLLIINFALFILNQLKICKKYPLEHLSS